LARSHRQPSYLLDPQREVVPYRLRPAEQTRLQEWLFDDEPVSVLLLSGPGGQGKTRLAGHLATTCHAAGWAVTQAVERTPRLRAGSPPESLLGETQPLLVLVDYAERWRLGVLVQLVDNLPLDYPGRRVRVLLLARPGTEWWDTTVAELDRSGVDLADPIILGEFTDIAGRARAFTEAAVAFAGQLARPVPTPSAPADLNDDAYGSPLTLHMAALAAVCAADQNEAAPARRDLSRFLLHHERRYWTAAASAGGGSIDVIEQLVWLATLLGPLAGQAAATALLRRARLADGDAHASQLLTLHERLYPITRPALPEPASDPLIEVPTLLPLRPDRFGEDFIGQHLAGRPHSTALLADLIGDGSNLSVGIDVLAVRRCLIVLTAAADRHPAATTTLFTLLRRQPTLTAHATAPVLQLVVDRAPDDLAEIVDAALSPYSTELLGPACDLAHRLTTSLPADAPPALRAQRLVNFGIRLSNLGRREEALQATTEAVDIRRRLARHNPAEFEPDLAGALSSLGTMLSNLGHREEALQATTDAVDIRRRLARHSPAEFEPDLARALTNLGAMLSNLGQWARALEATIEAIEVYRRLAPANPDAFEPDLASALTNLGVMLSNLGHREEEALEATTEAVEVYRRLAAANPAAFEPYLARVLWGFARVRAAGHVELPQALAAAEESIVIHLRLGQRLPPAFLADLRGVLTTLADVLDGLGRGPDADNIRRRIENLGSDE
jgi:tetratricopeptide (TPR) repeat protein